MNFTTHRKIKEVKLLLRRYRLLNQNRYRKLYIPQGLYIALRGYHDIERYLIESGVPYLIVKDENLEAFAGIFNPEPLFFTIKDDALLISDDIYTLIHDGYAKWNSKGALELLEFNYVLHHNTLINDIFLLEAGKKLVYQDRKFHVKTEFIYIPTERIYDKELAEEQLWRIAKEVFRDYAEILRNKFVVVPLSAGYDSRFVISMLYLMKIRPVALTYGAEYSYEIPTAKNVAKNLDLCHVIIEYATKDWNNICKILPEYLIKNSQLFRTPNIQELISTIKFNEILQDESLHHNKDIVFVPGDGGDFLSGKLIAPKAVMATDYIEGYELFLRVTLHVFIHHIRWRSGYLRKLYVEVKHYNPDCKLKIYQLIDMFDWRRENSNL